MLISTALLHGNISVTAASLWLIHRGSIGSEETGQSNLFLPSTACPVRCSFWMSKQLVLLHISLWAEISCLLEGMQVLTHQLMSNIGILAGILRAWETYHFQRLWFWTPLLTNIWWSIWMALRHARFCWNAAHCRHVCTCHFTCQTIWVQIPSLTRMPHLNSSPWYLQLCSSTELAVDCRRKWAVNNYLSYADGVCHIPWENAFSLFMCCFEITCNLKKDEFSHAFMDLSVCQSFNYAATLTR